MKKSLSYLLALTIIITSLSYTFAANAASVTIYNQSQLADAFSKGGNYALGSAQINSRGLPINSSVKIEGNNNTIKNSDVGAPAMFYQNENVSSEFSNVKFVGSKKQDVGIWLGAGNMTFNNCSTASFQITTGRYSAIAAAGTSRITLNNSDITGNSSYDLYLTDKASAYLNGTSKVDTIRIESNYIKLNIGSGWSGTTSITFANPVSKIIGTVADSADISNITVTNDGYYLQKSGNNLLLKTDKSSEIHFDMAQRQELYKGSTGFLYGAAEINVPSIDLLYGLKPDTMVQKAYGGKQHPTGDAVRTSSALLSAGVRDMQIYLQDNYLEWPYDAPVKDGEIDLDAYQKTVEGIIYGMICDEAQQGDGGAFKGSDGKYYLLNENRKNYSYVLFNEPDQIWYWGNLEGLKKAWKKIYKAVKAIDSDARCVGPNFSGFNEDSYDSFLKYCRDNDCLPEIISWHELGDISLTDYNKHYDAVMTMVDKYYSDSSYQPQLMVNEYARHYDIGAPGGLVKWLSMFEDRDMSGCMAYWAMANTLNEMAADQNSPSSTWWVYHWYAQMTGRQCPLTSPEFDKTRFYGLTSYDEDINTAYALFGGDENQHSTETVFLDNIDSTALQNDRGAVHVKLYAVSFSGQLGASYKPYTIFDGNVKADGNTVKLTVTDTDEMDAYFAVITKPRDNSEGTAMDGVTLPVISYEAENAKLLGGATAYDKDGWATFATSGRGDVGNINNYGDGVEFTVNVAESGYYNASLFYSLQAPYVNPKTLKPDANGQNRGIGKALPYGVTLDGKQLENITLESTVTWSYKNHCDFQIYLSAGEHKLTFKHINGNEGSKGNLQLVAALDKLDLVKASDSDNDFEISLSEQKNFKTDSGYRITAIAPKEGYYTITADGEISLSKQCIDYAADAKSESTCSVYDTETGNTVYLAQGANTLLVKGNANTLSFRYEAEKTNTASTVIYADDFTLHGNNPYLKNSSYAVSEKVVSELGIGQSNSSDEKPEYNYLKFKVNAKSGGVYNLSIRYSNDEPAPIMLKADGSTYIHPYNIDLVERYAQISVNGAEPETVYFKNTLSWDTFKIVNIQVTLNEGENEITINNDNSYQFSTLVNSTAPEIDTITVSPLTYGEYKAELVKGAPSVKHILSGDEALTKATTSKDGKIVKNLACSECGYKTVVTEVIPKIAAVSTVSTSYTYTGKQIKPAVKVTDSKKNTVSASSYTVSYSNNVNVGTATVTVTFKGNYTGTKTATFKILPKGTSLKTVKSPKSKTLNISWQKQTKQITGYEIQYAENAKFTKAKTVTVKSPKKTSATVKKLKAKKKYYVRIRTYKTVSKTKYFSSWSKAKSIKIK